jgi:uncharacterized sporulation protein YeaH/YhbH (DUF444 family)
VPSLQGHGLREAVNGGSKMEFAKSGHVFKVVPDVYGIKAEYDEYLAALALHEKDPDIHDKPDEVVPVFVHIKGISQETFGEGLIVERLLQENHTREKASELTSDKSISRIDKHVVKIENLASGGESLTGFMQVHKHDGMRELSNWITSMVYSEDALRVHEIKN